MQRLHRDRGASEVPPNFRTVYTGAWQFGLQLGLGAPARAESAS